MIFCDVRIPTMVVLLLEVALVGRKVCRKSVTRSQFNCSLHFLQYLGSFFPRLWASLPATNGSDMQYLMRWIILRHRRLQQQLWFPGIGPTIWVFDHCLQSVTATSLRFFWQQPGYSDGSSRLGFVLNCEGDLVDVVTWPEVIQAGKMEGPKLIASLHFFFGFSSR